MPIDARHPKEIRADIRAGRLTTVTAGLAPGYVQANLAVLPREQAYDFLLFCQRNPRPCPLIEVTDVGSPEPVGVAPGADLRTDIPRYRIYKDGVLADEVTDVRPFWRDDLVAFLLGCSFTFEWALLDAGIPMRHIEMGKSVMQATGQRWDEAEIHRVHAQLQRERTAPLDCQSRRRAGSQKREDHRQVRRTKLGPPQRKLQALRSAAAEQAAALPIACLAE